MLYTPTMTTLQTKITFKCKKCKTKGSAVLSETDHPYNTDTYVHDVTDGFRVANPLYPSADVFCTKCGRKVL
ncbi:MAG: hypothetical protein QOJ94_611 [Sphingomonadales bacterium]|nr:hypothetical protein [Sphingomonadales bacterium]